MKTHIVVAFSLWSFIGAASSADEGVPSWADLFDLSLPRFTTHRDPNRQETLGQQFAALQQDIAHADPKHRQLPVFLSPRAAVLPVRAAMGGETLNMPVKEAVKYLCDFSQHKLKVSFTEHGILISTEDEKP